jgi:hypothetical protein
MNKISVSKLSFLVFLCAGCVENKAGSDLPVAVAAQRSLPYAKKDQVDLTHYTVRSVAEYGNARTSIIDRTSNHEYDVAVLRKLYGKRYWEVCYGDTSPEVASAMYCYYLDKSDYGLLAAYRMK